MLFDDENIERQVFRGVPLDQTQQVRRRGRRTHDSLSYNSHRKGHQRISE